MLSFLIVNQNGAEVFKKGIASIIVNVKEAEIADYEIVVVDNASTEDLSWLARTPHVVLKKNRVNQFFSVPTNDTVTYSKGNILFILNNDIILQAGCLSRLLKVMKDTSADAVVPQLQYPDGILQQSITGIPTWKDILFAALGLHIFFPKKDKWRLRLYDYSKQHAVTDQPMFSALMLTRKTWKDVGMLDPRLPLLWNDVDWFFRFHRKNKKCVFAPQAVAIHTHGMSVNKYMWKKLYLLSQGCYIFLTKHSSNKSLLYKTFISLLCIITFFERIPIEFAHRIYESREKK